MFLGYSNGKKINNYILSFLSQVIAFSDILIILFFTNIFTKTELFSIFGLDLSIIFHLKFYFLQLFYLDIISISSKHNFEKLEYNVQEKQGLYIV